MEQQLNELKIKIFDLNEQQEILRYQYNELEKQKQQFHQEMHQLRLEQQLSNKTN
jgi:hypothetical protein